MITTLYVYGTLRPGNTEIFRVPGVLFDIGMFPGIRLCYDRYKSFVLCEKVEIKDWAAVDRYEGYFPDDPAASLYIRRKYADGFIYEFNHRVSDHKIIESGDWLEYRRQKKGSANGIGQ